MGSDVKLDAGYGPAQQTEAAIAPEDHAIDTFADAFRIGEWLVDPRLNQLREAGGSTVRHLEPRLARLLCFLAMHAGEVVERDVLVTTLWPRVIVNENSLTRAVSELRKQLTLGQKQASPYIETIPKRGYRLCVPVQMADSMPLPQHAPEQQKLWPTMPLLTQVRESAVAALCLALTLGVWLQWQSEGLLDSLQAPALVDELVYTPELASLQDGLVVNTSQQEAEDAESASLPVISQDETRFAFIKYGAAGSTIFLGELDSNYDPVPIYSTGDILYNLAWSPLEDALLFAGKPAVTTTALFDQKEEESARLYVFDLESFRLSLLVEQSPTDLSAKDNELSLT